MTLRDQVIADLPVFLNTAEFGDTLEINGVEMACVLVNDETTNAGDGVSELESTLYIRASELADPPAVRERVTVNERLANVIRVDEEQGMLVIRLQWHNS